MNRNAWLEGLRFLCVGGSATALQYALLIGLVHVAAWAPLTASVTSYALSTLYNYLANHRLTFRSSRSHLSALPRFLLIALAGLGLNAAIMWLGHERWHLHYLMAQLLATATTLGWNFAASRRWAFAPPPR